MSSVDYKVFVQAEIEECSRRADVYTGVQDDLETPAEHMTVEHLETLLARPLPRELRSLYLAEYAEIRAGLRAVAMVGLTRRDFFDHAAQMSISDREFLGESLARNTRIGSLSVDGFTDEGLTELREVESTYTTRKNEVVDRLKSENGVLSDDIVAGKDVVRNAMTEVPGTNSRGVSTGRKNT